MADFAAAGIQLQLEQWPKKTKQKTKQGHLHIAGLAVRAGLVSDDGDSPDDDRRAFVDLTFIICVL